MLINHVGFIEPPSGGLTNNGVVPYNSYFRELNKINSLRRKSAHTGVLGQQDVEAIKKIYYDDGFLQVLK